MSYYLLPLRPDCLSQEAPKVPRLGLVLSGGGACGIAHIGVLMVMDEEGLRPDYITGVSMGSLIGSLYSAGYSGDSMAAICRNLDWNLIISNRIPEKKIIYGEKDHFYNSIITLPVTRNKVKLPTGLINGQQVENTLSYYLWNVAETKDFSKLPIPFMCLAFDLIKCTKVELRSGYLPDAVRASCAVPYIFTPLMIDSMLLVDGGVIRNFAAIESKQMGADILIGSYTGSRYREENDLQSISGIMTQLGFYSSINDFHEQKKLVDYLIEPKTSDIPPTSFESYDTLILRGYRAAEPFRKIFRMLADSLNMKDRPMTTESNTEHKSYTFDRIVVNGNKLYSTEQIIGVLGIRPGEKVDREKLTENIDLLYGKAWFEKVKYRIVPINNSLVLEIDCIEKPRASFFGAVHYDNAINAGLILGLTVRDPLVRSSMIDFGSFIGEYPRINFSFIKFIGKNQKYSASANLLYDDTFVPKMELAGVTEDTESRNLYYGISISRRLGLNNLFKLNGQIENRYLLRDQITETGREKFNYTYSALEIGYHSNTLNTKYFPEKGMKADVSFATSRLLYASHTIETPATPYQLGEGSHSPTERFYTLKGGVDYYLSRFKRWTLNLGGDMLLMSHTDSISSMNNMYFVGGIDAANSRSVAALGFHPLQLQSTRMAGIRLNIDYEIIDKVHLTFLTGITAIIKSYDAGNLLILPGAGLGAGYLSIIGPVRAGIMYGYDKNETYFNRLKGFISVGYNF